MRWGGFALRQGPGVHWLIGSIMMTLVVLSVSLIDGFRDSSRLADALDRRDKTRLVSHYLNQSTRQLANEQKAQISWDDAFKAVGEGETLSWGDTYLGDFLWSNFQHDRIYLVRPDGPVLAAWHEGQRVPAAEASTLVSDIRALAPAMNSNRQTLGTPVAYKSLADTSWPLGERNRPLARWAGRMISVGGKPALLSAVSIVPDTDYELLTRTPNFVVSIRIIDGAFLSRMEEALQLDGLHFRREPPTGEELDLVPLMASAQKRTLGYLVWTPRRPGAEIMKVTSPLLTALILYCIAALALAGMIIRRVRATSRELAASQAQAVHIALHDPMTALPNRTQFQQALTQRLEHEGTRAIIVAYVDIDRFKDVNDTLGHQAGDELICLAADRLRLVLQSGDLLARLGGDEFVIMRLAEADTGAVENLGESIMAAFAIPFTLMGQELDVTASCGLSWAPEHGMTAGELLRNADIALYQAKLRGRGRWRGFTQDMDETLKLRREIELDLRRAITEGQLAMVYQPIMCARTGRIKGLEALLRWNHPRRGPIMPGVFVPIAEQTGQMRALGDWITDRVFQDQTRWPGAHISLNLSPVQIMDAHFVDKVKRLVALHRVNPRHVTFEITEGVLMDRSARVLDVLSALRKIGFRIALDDFGTGYSSLSYLRTFEFDTIKIDRSFVHDIEQDEQAVQLLHAIVALGNSLDMTIIAEGVETDAQRALVAEAGCHELQGYLFSPPVPRSAVAALLEPNRKRSVTALRRAA
ncbi:MAG TPA: bifunctional diguanylate cyclase/phosphodiesterase [Chakrabartia sp.]|jgi:diguanylate cyclase (GGDEF)-like protein|nr:bifunctional diguanylate cyclase/phosphodiesterase [Chakrabartia sp.]